MASDTTDHETNPHLDVDFAKSDINLFQNICGMLRKASKRVNMITL